jgi:hypothetical protein
MCPIQQRKPQQKFIIILFIRKTANSPHPPRK